MGCTPDNIRRILGPLGGGRACCSWIDVTSVGVSVVDVFVVVVVNTSSIVFVVTVVVVIVAAVEGMLLSLPLLLLLLLQIGRAHV